MSHRFSRFVGV